MYWSFADKKSETTDKPVKKEVYGDGRCWMREESEEIRDNVRKSLFLFIQKIQGKHRISTSASMVSLPAREKFMGKWWSQRELRAK